MKDRLRELLSARQFDEVAQLAAKRKRVLGTLVSLTFSADPLIAWRAVEAMGIAAGRIAERDPEYVRNHLRRLHWLLSEESGGICWYAPQAMAEIIRRRPDAFSDYATIVATLLQSMAAEDLPHFRAGILWAIGRIAPVAREEIEPVLGSVARCLDDPDSQVRGMAVWCLVQAGKQEIVAGRKDLLSDDGPAQLYDDGQLDRTTVRALLHG
uniref:Uncharacterized protein n=1 Tax=uncultured sulfate-reducing bacterium TaxID=153939 RepID=Q3IBN7_9BACT|nr:conserved hypothetical protein [uncultured sulfate-reducing bacterium]